MYSGDERAFSHYLVAGTWHDNDFVARLQRDGLVVHLDMHFSRENGVYLGSIFVLVAILNCLFVERGDLESRDLRADG